jgi:hypothetical protein
MKYQQCVQKCNLKAYGQHTIFLSYFGLLLTPFLGDLLAVNFARGDYKCAYFAFQLLSLLLAAFRRIFLPRLPFLELLNLLPELESILRLG